MQILLALRTKILTLVHYFPSSVNILISISRDSFSKLISKLSIRWVGMN
jgi:hypothetical protein